MDIRVLDEVRIIASIVRQDVVVVSSKSALFLKPLSVDFEWARPISRTIMTSLPRKKWRLQLSLATRGIHHFRMSHAPKRFV